MAMHTEIQSSEAEVKITNGVVETPRDVSFSRAAAASSLVASAALLMAGKRKSALAAAVAAGAIAALERPDVVKRIWNSIPDYLRRGQDFLVKVEDMVSEISAQSDRLRDSLRRND